MSWLDVPNNVAVSDGVVIVDGAGHDLCSPLLLGPRHVIHVHIEILLEEEWVGHLHLAVWRQARTLVDKVLILLRAVNVNKTLLSEIAAIKIRLKS